MSQTDPRAWAMIRFEMPKRECCTTTLQPDPQGQWVLYTDAVQALADAERVGMERAAKIADDFDRLTCAEMERKYRLRIDVRRLNLGDNIARCIRSQAQADKEG